ncbi:hypothetical protein [Hyalangium gracile]|uniref:hypothetical protein n=1 Tax=Hyalangium gracile TaxID=394092 RepID=UPI001CCC4015|nr:hypothetical protein [Hyalangium gracile]
MRRSRRDASPWPAVLATCVLLTACVTPHSVPRQYAQGLDSGSNGCREAPILCLPQPGEKMATIPPLAGTQATLLSIAAAAKVVQTAIDATLETRIRQALKECADKARADVMDRHFQRSPTREECQEVVEHDAQGQPVTRAMLLGREQHQAALECAELRLRQLKPGGFTLSPRYRYDPSTNETRFMSPEEVKSLLDQGRAAELRGTIEPDLVIHLPGQPLHVQRVFDFKFPCVNTDKPSRWRAHPKGHPHEDISQKDLYERALKVVPKRVQPHIGVIE